METCLLNYFILNKELKSSCDFNPLLLQEGKGVYEIIRIIGQKPLFLEEHIDRFFQSMRLAGIKSELTTRQIQSRLKALIEINQLKNGNIRFQFSIHPHVGPLFLAWITPSFYPTAEDYTKGISTISLKAERQNPNAKRDNLPVREQANQLIQQHDVFEVLLINKDGFITEGSRSNIFFISDEKIITPPLSKVLPGVTRSKIILLANENGIEVIERLVHLSELGTFNAAFLSGTSIKVLPVNQIDNITFYTVHPIMERIQHLYNELCIGYIDSFYWE